MTPAEEAVLAAARAYRDSMQDPAVHAEVSAAMAHRLMSAAEALVDAPPVEAPTVATVRPWPDPEAYRALACEVFVIKPPDPSKSLPPGTNLSALFGVDIVDVLE